jgi:periplasmic copper chaperone A
MRKGLIFAALLALAGCGPREEAPAAPWVSLPAAPGRPGAGYFDVAVPADKGALVAVSSPRAARIEMHETMTSGTMSSMRPLARVVPENGRILFDPGGRHLMLFDMDQALKPGDRVALTLRFERGGGDTIAAEVTPPGAGPPSPR